ncbi:MAG TPA: metallophosphoesterase family protein [Flavisolibacter sp.]
MTRIGLLSDTHNYLDENIFRHFESCDAIWHCGDFGSAGIAAALEARAGKQVTGVYGNIDGADIRGVYPEQVVFMCEEVRVMMRHIGGFPPRYNPETKRQLQLHRPQLFISGHSHILRIMYDNAIGCLYMNPGAAGNQGWHKIRTIVRFVIDGPEIKDCEVIELGRRGGINTSH